MRISLAVLVAAALAATSFAEPIQQDDPVLLDTDNTETSESLDSEGLEEETTSEDTEATGEDTTTQDEEETTTEEEPEDRDMQFYWGWGRGGYYSGYRPWGGYGGYGYRPYYGGGYYW